LSGEHFTEAQLEQIERMGDASAIPALVRAIREQQHDLDNLRLSLDVARRDREELRVALLRLKQER
jgi:hypothetical protein